MEDDHGGGKKAVEVEDLQEEEVWAMINAKEEGISSSKTRSSKSKQRRRRSTSSSSSAWSGGAALHQSSAAVEIRKKKQVGDHDDACESDDEEGEGEGEILEMGPPHEYLDRRLERVRIASHSMCEGVGRTLKGRDLSKMRRAILTKTGFIE